MKKKWLLTMGLAHERYVDEADPEKGMGKGRKTWIMVLAACAMLALVIGNLWLFLPHGVKLDDISAYRDSDYYSIIEKINYMSAEYPEYKNNATMLLDKLNTPHYEMEGDDGMMDTDDGADFDENLDFGATLTPPDTNGNGDKYQEITDNQVSGVIEADLIKRSDTHIYYLDKNVLRVFTIDREDSKEVGSFKVVGEVTGYKSFEFYLSKDAKTATVVYTSLNENLTRCLSLVSLDVENPESISVKGKFEITGDYISSRSVGSSILLINEFRIDKDKLDFSDESSFLPQINTGAGFENIKPENIISPDKLTDRRYTVVVKLEEDTLAPQGSLAYLSYSDDVYVSSDNIYLTRVFDGKTETEQGYVKRYAKTEISVLSYKDGFESLGSTVVDGYVKNRYSMDEYNGILRVVTTTNEYVTPKQHSDRINQSYLNSVMITAVGRSSANLYCIDLDGLETVGSVIRFAPDYEEVQSVRFDKDFAYVCTSIEMSDPVFFFDLSDLSNITYKDTGTIDGYSTSLINLNGGYLLGVGVGGFGSLKLEVYEESADGVRSVCSYEIQGASYSLEYKSYYVNREKSIIGLGYTLVGSTDASRYALFCFDGYELTVLLDVAIDGENDLKRAVLIDGYVYLFGTNCFAVEKIFNS